MTWDEVPRELFFSLSGLLLVLFGASGHFVEFWVLLVVAETVASPLFFVFWVGIVQCLLNLLSFVIW